MEKTIYLDTREEYSLEDYQEYCEFNGIEFNEENTEGFYEYQSMMRDGDIRDFYTDLENSEHKNDKVIITGILGLWNGAHDIYPVVETLENAIYKCIHNMDDFKIFVDEDGTLNVVGYHHDGTNCFEIHFLTEYGKEHFDEDEWNEMSDEEKEKCFNNGDFDYLL